MNYFFVILPRTMHLNWSLTLPMSLRRLLLRWKNGRHHHNHSRHRINRRIITIRYASFSFFSYLFYVFSIFFDFFLQVILYHHLNWLWHWHYLILWRDRELINLRCLTLKKINYLKSITIKSNIYLMTLIIQKYH